MPPYPTNDMAHIRDIRPSALEIKFLLDPATAAGVASWARANLAPDPNGTGAWGDEYLTTSLYFDNASYDVFNRRGSFGRSKYRIRRYGEESSAFLERKMRQPAVLAKRRTRLSCDDLDHAVGRDRRSGVARLLVSSPRRGAATSSRLPGVLCAHGPRRHQRRPPHPAHARPRPARAARRAARVRKGRRALRPLPIGTSSN